MKKVIQGTEVEKIVSNSFKKLGFRCVGFKSKNANGPDCYAIGKSVALKVEIKRVKRMSKTALQVPPVEKNRLNDDLIAIIINNYVLIEPMKQHLKLCSKEGYRTLTELAN